MDKNGSTTKPSSMDYTYYMERRLLAQYNSKMANSTAPVFSDFETYAKTLPRRVVGNAGHGVLDLYKLPHWADPEAVKAMAIDLESNRRKLEGDRNYVRYATAPTASGKTASILAAFLNSAESGRTIGDSTVSLSYYIYIPFENNNSRNFRARTPDRDFYEQGAWFMLKCLDKFFNNTWGTVNTGDINIPGVEEIKIQMKNLFREKVGGGRCLVHVDEHHSMLAHANEEEAALFRRGALKVLAEASDVVVVATYTKLLTEVDPAGSSNVCRYPIAVPLLDIDAMTKSIPEFDMKVTGSHLSVYESGILGAVRFRLAQKILSIGLLALHKVSSSKDKEMDDLRRSFAKIVESKTAAEDRLLHLHDLLSLDSLFSDQTLTLTKNASVLLCGVYEWNWDSVLVHRQIRDLLLTPSGLATTTIKRLLGMRDPNVPVYFSGRKLFRAVLMNGQDKSLLSSKPLEVAFIWVIAVRSAENKTLQFGTKEFDFDCQELVPGRLFKKKWTEDIASTVNDLKEATLYYADEGKGSIFKICHPLCDLFFRTKGELVVIDITAINDAEFDSGRKPIQKKRKNMIEWVKNNMSTKSIFSFHGIVLAPFDAGDTTFEQVGDRCSVSILRGADATFHLGGLSQFLFWFTSPNDVQVKPDHDDDVPSSQDIEESDYLNEVDC